MQKIKLVWISALKVCYNSQPTHEREGGGILDISQGIVCRTHFMDAEVLL